MIDLLPLQAKIAIQRIRLLRTVTVWFYAVVLLCISGLLLLLPSYIVVKSHEKALQSYTHELEARGAVVSSADIAQLEARTTTLREKLTSKAGPSPFDSIVRIQNHLTSGVTLTGFEIANPEKRTVQIRGVATTRTALQQFIVSLQGDEGIAAVDSPITNFVKSTENEFTMTLTLKPL